MVSSFVAKITNVDIVGPYQLHIRFDDQTEQIIDFEPVLYGYYYGPLRDQQLFNQVRIDPNFHTLVWPNGADFDPMTLYNWASGAGDELIRRAKAWSNAPEGAVVEAGQL